MNILIIGNGHTTKIGDKFYKDKHTSSFISELCSLGHSISWHEPIYEEIDGNSDLHDKELPEINFELLSAKPVLKKKLYKLVFFIRTFFRLIKSLPKIDLIYLFLPGSLSMFSGVLFYIFRKNIAIYVRADINYDSYLQRLLFRNANFILATGSHFQQGLSKYNKESYVVTTMINISKEDIRHKNIIEKPSFDILFVGRAHAAKGIWPLVEAAKILSEKGFQFTLHIVGGGSELQDLQNYVQIENLSEYILLYGMIAEKSELQSLYIRADVFVLPSFVEGVPRVLYEAMTYSLPVITTFVGSIPSIMTDKYNCLQIPVNESLALASTLELLKNDIKLQKYLSTNAYKTIETFFSTRSKYSHAEQLDRLIKGLTI